MERWANENIGKMFINKTGRKAKFIGRADKPSVNLDLEEANGPVRRIGFGIDSLNAEGWELYKEDKDDLFTGEEALQIKKALKFVEHLKNHPEVKNSPTNAGIPMCKICDKTIDEIYADKDNWNLTNAIKKWIEKNGLCPESKGIKELFFILKKNNQKVNESKDEKMMQEGIDFRFVAGMKYILEELDNRAGKLN